MPRNASADAAVGPLERGLSVLRVLAHAPGGRLRPSDVARRTGLARSPVDRIATTLIRLGYLREEDRELVLAPRVMELGSAYLRGSGVAAALGPPAAALADELDESVSLAVPDGDAVRFVSQTARRRTLSVAFRIGDALPAERCAPGALFGADWDEEQFAAWRARHAADPEDAGFPAVPRPAGGHRDEADFRARIGQAAPPRLGRGRPAHRTRPDRRGRAGARQATAPSWARSASSATPAGTTRPGSRPPPWTRCEAPPTG